MTSDCVLWHLSGTSFAKRSRHYTAAHAKQRSLEFPCGHSDVHRSILGPVDESGHIRLVTPDLRKHVELYLARADSVTGDVGRSYLDLGLVVEHPVDLARIPIASFGHHEGYLYDFGTLEAELVRAGFGSGGAQMAVEAQR